jgi:hypothetical protein
LHGGLPLERAFWFWGILGGGTVSRFCTLFALTLVAADAPAWLAGVRCAYPPKSRAARGHLA